MIHKDILNIYLYSKHDWFIENTEKFLNNFDLKKVQDYELIVISNLEEIKDHFKVWDILIIDSYSMTDIHIGFKEVLNFTNYSDNIIWFINDQDHILLEIIKKELNIFLLPTYKQNEHIEEYKKILFLILAKSYQRFKDIKTTKSIEKNFQNNKNQNLTIIAIDSTTIQLINNIEKLATYPGDINILFLGPTGTGKNLFAEYFHYLRELHKGEKLKYQYVDVLPISKDLINSHFFGHKKGSFTGAINDSRGLIEDAQGGVLHIDELGDSIEFQNNLLNLLERKEYRSVGDTKTKIFSGDIIVSTNVDIFDKSLFREDLIERFNFKIRLDALNRRPKELDFLINKFEKEILTPNDKRLDDQAKIFLLNQDWPRNIRQLENFFRECNLKEEEIINRDIAEEIYQRTIPTIFKSNQEHFPSIIA